MTNVLTATIPGHDGMSSKDISDAAASQILETGEDLEGNTKDKDNTDSADGVTRPRVHQSSEDPSTKNDSSSLSTTEINNVSDKTDAFASGLEREGEEEEKRSVVPSDTNEAQALDSEAALGSDETKSLIATTTNQAIISPGTSFGTDAVIDESTNSPSATPASHPSLTVKDAQSSGSMVPNVDGGEQPGAPHDTEATDLHEKLPKALQETQTEPEIVPKQETEETVLMAEHIPTENDSAISVVHQVELATKGTDVHEHVEDLLAHDASPVSEQLDTAPAVAVDEQVETKEDTVQAKVDPVVIATDAAVQTESHPTSNEEAGKVAPSHDADTSNPLDETAEPHSVSERSSAESSGNIEASADEPSATATHVNDKTEEPEASTPEDALTNAHNAHAESEVIKDESVDTSSVESSDTSEGTVAGDPAETQHQMATDPETASEQQAEANVDALPMESTGNSRSPDVLSINEGVEIASEAETEADASQAAVVYSTSAKESDPSPTDLESDETSHSTPVVKDDEQPPEAQTHAAPASKESLTNSDESKAESADMNGSGNQDHTSDDPKDGGVADDGQDETVIGKVEDDQPSTEHSVSTAQELDKEPEVGSLSTDRQKEELLEGVANNVVDTGAHDDKTPIDTESAVEPTPDAQGSAATEPIPSQNTSPTAEVTTEVESHPPQDPSSQSPLASLTEGTASEVKSLDAGASGSSSDDPVDAKAPSLVLGEESSSAQAVMPGDESVSQVPTGPRDTEMLETSAVPDAGVCTAKRNDTSAISSQFAEPIEIDAPEVDDADGAAAAVVTGEPSIPTSLTEIEPHTPEASDPVDNSIPQQNANLPVEEMNKVSSAEPPHDQQIIQESVEETVPLIPDIPTESKSEAKEVNVDNATNAVPEPSATAVPLAGEQLAGTEEDLVAKGDAVDATETTVEQEPSVASSSVEPSDHQQSVDSTVEVAQEIPSAKLGLDERQNVQGPDEVSAPPAPDASAGADTEARELHPDNSSHVESESSVVVTTSTEDSSTASDDQVGAVLGEKQVNNDENTVEKGAQDEQVSNTLPASDGTSASALQSFEDANSVEGTNEIANQSLPKVEDSEVSGSIAVKTDVDTVSTIPTDAAYASGDQPEEGDGVDSRVEDALPDAESDIHTQDESDNKTVLDNSIASASEDTSTETEESETVVAPSEDSSSTDDQSTVHGGEVESQIVKEQVESTSTNPDVENSSDVKDVSLAPVAAHETISPSAPNEATEAVTAEVEKDSTSSRSQVVEKTDTETVTPVISAATLPAVETHESKSVGIAGSDSFPSSNFEGDLPQAQELPSDIVVPEEAEPILPDDETEVASHSLEAKAPEVLETGEDTPVNLMESVVVEESAGIMAEPVTQLNEGKAHGDHDLPSDAGVVEEPQSDVEGENATLTGSPERVVSIDSLSSRDRTRPKEDIGGQQDVGPIEAPIVRDTAQQTDFAEQVAESQAKDHTSDRAEDINVDVEAIGGAQSHHLEPSNDSRATVEGETARNDMLDSSSQIETGDAVNSSFEEDVSIDDQVPPPYEEIPTQIEDDGEHTAQPLPQSFAVPSEVPTTEKAGEAHSSAPVETDTAPPASSHSDPAVTGTSNNASDGLIATQVEIPGRGLTRMASSDTVTDLRPLPVEPTDRPKSPFPLSYSVTHLGRTEEVVDGAQQHASSVLPESFSAALNKGLSQVEPTGPSEPPKVEGDGPGVDDEIYPDESISEVDASEAKSDAPEPSMSPRSDLGILTPSFDTRSEVSVASHKPLPASSPRLDPDAPLPEVLQPHVVIPPLAASKISVQGSSGSDAFDLLTPLPTPFPTSLVQNDTAEDVEEGDVQVDSADLTVRSEDHADKDDVASLASADDSILHGMEALNSDFSDRAPITAEDANVDDNLSGLETEVDDEPASADAESEDNLADIESLAPASTESVNSEAWTESVGSGRLTTQASLLDESINMSDTVVLPLDNNFTMAFGGEVPAVIRRSRSDEDLTVAQPALPSTDEISLNMSESDFEPLTDASLTSSRRIDGISELDSIQETSTLASRPDDDDLPEIPTSTSSLAIPKLDDTDDTVILDSLPSSVDSSLSMEEQMAGYVSISSRLVMEDIPQYSSQSNILEMPNPDASFTLDSASDSADVGSIEPVEEETVGHLSNGTATPLASIREGLSATPRRRELSSDAVDQFASLTAFPTVVVSQTQDTQQGTAASSDGNTDFEPISPPQFARKRLESAASSRFPGSWVSTSPTVPHRPSLDVAQGEFSQPRMDGSAQGSTLGTPTESEEEKKGRCVIM